MRQCGDCQLCCKLLPVRSLEKPGGGRCRHQRHHKGCAVYARLHVVSPECRAWSCRWLLEDDTAGLSRPDRSGYVIDLAPDFVTLRNNETGDKQHIQVVQIWVDPKRREAWRDPALREYLLRRGKEGIAAIVRFDEVKALVVFPPNMASDGEWHEYDGPSMAEKSHSVAQIAEALGPMHVVVKLEAHER